MTGTVEDAVKSAFTISAELTCRNPQKLTKREVNNFMDDALEKFGKPHWQDYSRDKIAK